jgi:succinoglycan biosynthesis protein ExoA
VDRGPRVTIVVPCLDEESHIETSLHSVCAQDYPNLEILVVDGGSQDRTREIVTSLACNDPRIRLLENPRRTQPAALNVAWPQATGDFLVRVDAHATVPPDYVARIVDHFSNGNWGGVGGRKDAVATTPTGRAIAAALGSPFGVGNSTYHHGTTPGEVDHIPFGAYPIEVVRELGGWDETTPVNEDYEFDYRVRLSGRRLLFDPALRIQWRGRETLRLFGRQYRRYGRAKAKVVRKHPRSTALRHLAAPSLVAALGIAVGLAPLRPRIAVSITLPYLGVLVLGTVKIAPELNSVRERLTVPAALATMHLAWGIGFWEGLLGARVTQPPR